MKIIWDKVTTFSQFVAIVLFVLVFCLGYIVGSKYENETILGLPNATVIYQCKNDHDIRASFYNNAVRIRLDNKSPIYLVQTVSASGARFENSDNLVFWNKGNNAFIMKGDVVDEKYSDCSVGSN